MLKHNAINNNRRRGRGIVRKAEIITDAMDYTVDIPEESQGDVLTAWKYVKDAISANMPLEGTILGQPAVFSIEAGSSIKHIKIYDDMAGIVAAPDPTAVKAQGSAPKVGYYDFSIDRVFIGQKVNITGLGYFDDGIDYYLPRYVNNEPAADAISAANLKNLIEAWHHEHVESYPIVIAPPQGLDLSDIDEARAYIKDYIDEQPTKADAKATKDPKAKAWTGWKGGVNT